LVDLLTQLTVLSATPIHFKQERDMRHIGWAFLVVCAFSSLAYCDSDNAVYDGIDPSKLSPGLKLYFDTAEKYRKMAEDYFRKTISTGENLLELKSVANDAHKIYQNEESQIVAYLKTNNPNFQQAEDELQDALLKVAASEPGTDERIQAVKLRMDAQAEVQSMIDVEVAARPDAAIAQDNDLKDAALYRDALVKAIKNGVPELSVGDVHRLKMSLTKLVAATGHIAPPENIDGIYQGTADVGDIGHFQAMHIDQVVDPQSMVVSIGEKQFYVNTDTSGLTDNTWWDAPPQDVVIYSGTKTYPTAIGASNTVEEVWMFDVRSEIQSLGGAPLPDSAFTKWALPER
jgi:hypothetical protein